MILSSQTARRWVWHHLDRESRALLTRLNRLVPFSATLTMVPAASVPRQALGKIEASLRHSRATLRIAVARFRSWLRSPVGQRSSSATLQRRFVWLKLQFNAVLSQFDIFADVLVQRSELGTGVWIAGLDRLAADALRMPAGVPPAASAVCYLDRGHGAAIRRARTRLPGGDESPVAVIRIPRERMVGLGIGASLVHEAGHQAAEHLNLLNPLRLLLQGKQRTAKPIERLAWRCWERWIGEIIADLWSVGHLGLTATFGLIGVVGLPRFFMFRATLDDPHPFPWIRVLVNIALGRRLFPHPSWDQVEAMWLEMYPEHGATRPMAGLLESLRGSLDQFADMVLRFQPAAFNGLSIAAFFQAENRRPEKLDAVWREFERKPQQLHELRPTLALAAIGQARIKGQITPETESRTISRLLVEWALKGALSGHSAVDISSRTSMPCPCNSGSPSLTMDTWR